MTHDPRPDTASAASLLDILGAPAHVEVLAQRQELLRFGGSRVTYQHSEDSLLLRAKLVRGGRAAWGSLGTLDPEAVRGLRERLEAVLAHLPAGASEAASLPAPGPPSPASPPATCFEATVRGGAQERTALFQRARERLPADVLLGGSVAHSVVDHAVANSEGLCRAERRTRAALQVVAAMPDGRSSYGKLLDRDAARLEAEADAFLARVAEGLAPLPTRSLEPGSYPVLLEPQAMATILATLGYAAFGARAYHAGDSATSGRLGQPLASPLVGLADDALDPAGLPSGFDAEGVAKQRVPLIEAGAVAGVVYDTATARAAGVPSTGHAVPPGWRFGAGPSPSHLMMAAGTGTDEDLLRACGGGIAVQRVDYVRVIHPRQTLVTGTTRDATRWVDARGQVVARLPQFRFTLRLTDVLAGIRAVGARRERSEAVFLESIVAPAALVVDAFAVGAVTG